MRFFDVDFNPNMNFNRLMADIMAHVEGNTGNGMVIYSSSVLLDMVKSLALRRKNFFLDVYGLESEGTITLHEFAQKSQTTDNAVVLVKTMAFEQVSVVSKLEQIIPYPLNQLIHMTSDGIEKRTNLDEKGEKLYSDLLGIVNNSGYVWENGILRKVDDEKKEETQEKLQDLQARILEIVKPEVKEHGGIDFSLPIDVLNLPTEITTLLKNNAKGTVGEFLNMSDIELGFYTETTRLKIQKLRDEHRIKARVGNKNDVVLNDVIEDEVSNVLSQDIKVLGLRARNSKNF